MRCKNATITDNLIMHAAGHAGGTGAISLDVLSEVGSDIMPCHAMQHL